jgi:hypothetical protein
MKSNVKPTLEISDQGNKDAAAALFLYRDGDFATYFYLDTDHTLGNWWILPGWETLSNLSRRFYPMS